jgi:hypothetical protein
MIRHDSPTSACASSPRWASAALGLGVAALLLAPTTAVARPVRVPLVATGADSDAAGVAKVAVTAKRSRGRLLVRVRRLDAGQTFDVAIDGVRIGSLTTNRRGRGAARFASQPRGRAQLLGVDPRGRTVTVVSTAIGAPVLSAGVPSAVGGGDVRCCLPDDSGTECEDRTPAECATQGGADLGAGSCFPNPCGSTLPGGGGGGDIRCCLPDDSGPECEDRTPAECSAQGGVSLGAGSCTPNPCGGVATTSTTLPGGGAGTLDVTCERRSDRSRASVDARNVAAGTYGARLVSGPNGATAPNRASIGDEVEFDFDSEPDDVTAGATAIGQGFIVGAPPQVTGQLLSASGAVLLESTVVCEPE